MDLLPDELILRIFSLLTKDAEQLLRLELVCRRFYRITQETQLWFQVFRNNYPIWSSQVEWNSRAQPLIDWKDFMVHIARQNRRAQSFLLEFVPDETSMQAKKNKNKALRQSKVPQKRKLAEQQQEDGGSRLRPSTSSLHKTVCCDNDNKRSPPSPHSSSSMPIIHHSSSNNTTATTSPSASSSSSSSMDILDLPWSYSSLPSLPTLPSSPQHINNNNTTPANTTATTPIPSSLDGSSSSSSNSSNNNGSTYDYNRAILEQLQRQAQNQVIQNAFEPQPLANIHEEPVFERPTQQFYYPPPFRIQDPLVVDIDRVTKTGVVATGKHRKESPQVGFLHNHPQRSEHKILFWEYPSWRLIREFDLSFAPADTSCQITGIQTIRMFSPNNNQQEDGGGGKQTHKVRLFSLAVGQPLTVNNNNNNQDDLEGEDRVDLWQTVLIYRLFDNGATLCVAHLNMDGQLLGRDVFFFSEASWCRSNDGNKYDDDNNDDYNESVRDWMQIVAPEYADFDTHYTAFMLAIGPDFPNVSGCGRLVRFDIRGDRNILDPATEPVVWDPSTRRFTRLCPRMLFASRSGNTNNGGGGNGMRFSRRFGLLRGTAGIMPRSYGPPAEVIARIPMGRKISCMIHFRHPPQLNHLICTGSYVTDELTVYDWRFGLKVGVLPWKTQDERMQQQQRQRQRQEEHHQQQQQQQQQRPALDDDDDDDEEILAPPPLNFQMIRDQLMGGERQQQQQFNLMMDDHMDFQHDAAGDDDEDNDGDDRSVVQPWGLEATMVLPPYWGDEDKPCTKEDFARRGFRLIAVGDNRNDRLEIKVWDISYLLRVDWNPLSGRGVTVQGEQQEEEEQDHSRQFFWWKRGTPKLKQLARRMLNEHGGLASFMMDPILGFPTTRATTTTTTTTTTPLSSSVVELPYSPPKETQAMILVHRFERNGQDDDGNDGDETAMPVKYTAYNVLRTSLFLLTEEGRITVMDIETGKMIGTVDNVAAVPDIIGPQRQVRGIDVNVVGGNEIVVTSRQGLLRGAMVNHHDHRQ